MWSYRLDENWDPLDLMTRRNEVPQSESRSVAFHQFPKNRKYTFFFLLNYLQCLWNHACLLCNHVLQLDWTIGPPWFRMKHICMILFDSKEDIVVSQHVSTIKGWKSICVFHSFFSVGSLARVSIMSILPSNPDKNISSGNTSWRC